MGCFNLSCAFSGTPIVPGEDVVYLYLMNKSIYNMQNNNMFDENCYFEPLPYVLYETYDDYGRTVISKDKTTALLDNIAFSLLCSHFCSNEQNDTVNLPTSIEDLREMMDGSFTIDNDISLSSKQAFSYLLDKPIVKSTSSQDGLLIDKALIKREVWNTLLELTWKVPSYYRIKKSVSGKYKYTYEDFCRAHSAIVNNLFDQLEENKFYENTINYLLESKQFSYEYHRLYNVFQPTLFARSDESPLVSLNFDNIKTQYFDEWKFIWTKTTLENSRGIALQYAYLYMKKHGLFTQENRDALINRLNEFAYIRYQLKHARKKWNHSIYAGQDNLVKENINWHKALIKGINKNKRVYE